jgi:hypothetical protein
LFIAWIGNDLGYPPSAYGLFMIALSNSL